MAQREFKIVDEDDDAPTAASPQKTGTSEKDDRAVNWLLTILKLLGQRAIAGVSDLFTLVTVVSAWWIWNSTPDPNVHQIVYAGVYAVFVLCVNVIVRKL